MLRLVHQKHPSVQPLTVYKTLDLLEKINELKRINLQQADRYELTSSTHPHFVCEETEKVEDIENPEVRKKLIEIKELMEKDFTKVELHIYHSCADDANHDEKVNWS